MKSVIQHYMMKEVQVSTKSSLINKHYSNKIYLWENFQLDIHPLPRPCLTRDSFGNP